MTEHTLDRDPRDELDEELFGDRAGRRIGRSTVILAAGLLVVVAFVGGALAQKHWGTTGSVTSAVRAPAAGGFGGAGFPAGGFGAGAGAGAGTGAGAGAQTGGQAAATGPAVVGTVVSVSGRTLTVKNFGGKVVKVTVPEGAAVTSATDLAKLAAGQSVSVAGSSAADGSVTATSVTARAAS